MTKDQLQEWKTHPHTKEILDLIDSYIVRAKDRLPIIIYQNFDSTAMANAEAKGLIDGMKNIYAAIEEAAE